MGLKVLFISGTFPPARCGVGDYLYNLANGLSNSNDTKIYVITSDYIGVSRNNRNPCVYPIINNWKNIKILFDKIIEKVKSINPNIIHFQYPTKEHEKCMSVSLLPLLVKARFPKLRVVETFHEPLFHFHLKAKLRYLPTILSSDGLIFVEQDYRDRTPWLHSAIIRKKFIKVITVASNIPYIHLANEEVDDLRSKLKLSKGELLLVYFGTITKAKGLESLIEILKRVKAKLLIISSFKKNDIYHTRLLNIFKKEGLKRRIIVTGFIPVTEVAKSLAIADVCVFPYVRGISPKNTSFLVSLNQGVFTIATSMTAHGYFPERNLYFVSPGDTEEMIRAIEKYAGEKINPDFKILPNWNDIVDKHKKFYENILKI